MYTHTHTHVKGEGVSILYALGCCLVDCKQATNKYNDGDDDFVQSLAVAGSRVNS